MPRASRSAMMRASTLALGAGLGVTERVVRGVRRGGRRRERCIFFVGGGGGGGGGGVWTGVGVRFGCC